MGIQLGIDFGSTYTYVYMMEEDSDAIQRVGAPTLYENAAGIPTKIGTYMDEQNHCKTVIGQEARGKFLDGELDGISQDNFEERDLKSSLRERFLFADPEPEQRAQFCQDEGDIVEFFNQIFDGTDGTFQGRRDDVTKIVFGCPAPTLDNDEEQRAYEYGHTDELYYSSAIKDILANVFPNLSPDDMESVAEPVLAGMAIVKSQNLEDGTYLFIDLGGSTNDFTILTVEGGRLKDGAPIRHSTQGGEGPSGKQYDSNMMMRFGITRYSAQKAKEKLFPNPRSAPSGEPAFGYKQDGTSIRFRYCKIPGGVEEADCKYLLHDCSFEELYEKTAKRAAEAVQEIMNENPINLDKVYFVGGSARMRPLRERIMEKLLEVCKERLLDKSCDYIGDYSDDYANAARGVNESVTCSNIVAYGAVLCAHYGMRIKRDPLENYKCVFGSKDNAFDLKFEPMQEHIPFEPPTQAYVSYFDLKPACEVYQDADKSVVKLDIVDIEGNTHSISCPVFSYKKDGDDYVGFWFYKHRYRYPTGGVYAFNLTRIGRNALRIFFIYTEIGDMYIFLLPRDSDNSHVRGSDPEDLIEYICKGKVNMKYAMLYGLRGRSGRLKPKRGECTSAEIAEIRERFEKCF